MTDEDDKSTFHEALKDVTPLKRRCKANLRTQPKSLEPRFSQADDKAVMQELRDLPFDDEFYSDSHEDGEFLLYAQPGVQKRVLQKLKQGKYRVQDEFDLHGMVVDEARSAVKHFLAECLHNGHGCVRIIHGKGLRSSQRGPVLKRKLAGWLAQRQEVLAYCSARPVDGGTGAVYVLLRKG